MTQQADEPAYFSRKTFLEHLVDLRNTLVRGALALVIGMAVAVPLAPHIFRALSWPLQRAGKDPEKYLKIFDVMGGFNLTMLVVMISGLIIAAPAIVFFIAGFVFPGLTKTERKAIGTYGIAAVAFFIGGVCMGYFFALPVSLQILMGMGEWMGPKVDFLAAGDYVIFCLYLLLGFGLSFELPVVLVLLGHLGLIDSLQLRSARSYAIVIIMIIAMIITPDTSAFSMLVMAVPMILMYEMSIWIIWFKERRTKAAE